MKTVSCKHLLTQFPSTLKGLAEPIQRALADKALLPYEHLLNAGYVDAAFIVTSQTEHEVTIVGPVRPDSSWQAQTEGAYDSSTFTIDWEQERATCPQGQTSTGWSLQDDKWGNPRVVIQFPRQACLACPVRDRCTTSKDGPRHLSIRPQAEHEALQAARHAQQTPDWQARYAPQAGIEGTLSQGVRAYELRHTRYIGLQKTALQHILTAAAINISRMVNWLDEVPHRQTRPSRFATLAPAA